VEKHHEEPQLNTLCNNAAKINGRAFASTSKEPIPTKVMDCYWRFAAERFEIYLKRLRNAPAPWTSDPILSEYRFTNIYRVTDRVTQFLLRDVIYNQPHTNIDLFFRILLFKLFNKIETWQLLVAATGEPSFKDYKYSLFDKLLSNAMASGRRIYSAAYIMPSGGKGWGRKHRAHLSLLEKMIADEVPQKLSDMATMREAFILLRSYPLLGDFLAYQYVTDLNYSPLTHFSENEFVVAGPGAHSGLEKCFSDFGTFSHEETIQWVCERQEVEFARRGIEFKPLCGRRLQLIDCQNLFCEIDKYSRVRFPTISRGSGRKRIKRRFSPDSPPAHPFFPPKWNMPKLAIKPPRTKAMAGS
jgi:hypothetical protein